MSRKHYSPKQIIYKLREAEVLISQGLTHLIQWKLSWQLKKSLISKSQMKILRRYQLSNKQLNIFIKDSMKGIKEKA